MIVLLALSSFAVLVSSDYTSTAYCVDQPAGVESFPGDSATLFCRFAYPQTIKKVKSTNIAWKFGNDPFGSTEIYNSTETKQYDDRISLLGNPKKQQNGTIVIKNLTLDDTNIYYCRVQLIFHDKTIEEWQNTNGTQLSVRDRNSLVLDQPPIIAAAVGDTVTIPCNYSTAHGANVSLSSVQWRFCPQPTCDNIVFNNTVKDQSYNPQISVLEGSAYLQIKKVDSSDSGFYGCEVKGVAGGTVYQNKRERGTQLIVTEKTNQLNISQPGEVVFDKPTTINCSFTEPRDRVPVWVGVFWIVGDSTDVFAYHPDPDLIHVDYRGKTRLVGRSNLLLEEFHGPDNITFYCRVAIRQCVTGHRVNPDPFHMILEQGSGTLLRFYDSSDSESLRILIITGTIIPLVLLIAFLVVALICFRKRKGTYKEHTHSGDQFPVPKTLHVTEYPEHEVPELYIQRPQQETAAVPGPVTPGPRPGSIAAYDTILYLGSDVVYAAVDHSAASVPSKQKHVASSASEIIYSTVKTS